jgi:integrase/recombinase XerD
MAKVDLYDYPKRLEQAIEKLREEKEVCKENVDSIISFSKVKLAKGTTYGRVAKTVYCLRFLARWLKKPFKKATKDDLIALIGELEQKGYSEYTKYDFRVILKMFYKWLEGKDEFFPKKITWLKKSMKHLDHKLPEQLITEEEVLKLADAAMNPRDKTLILVLYETGCRIGELLSLQMRNVSFDQYGAVLRVTGKTGDRRVRIISSAPFLASWLNAHPRAKDPEAWLWIQYKNHKITDKCLRHGTIYATIRKIAKRAGIQKKIYPHLFRHSRATSLANKLTESQMKEHFGWVQGSDMAATYVHLSGRDVDNAFLKLHGLAPIENAREEKMKLKTCQRCKEHNSPAFKFCTRCGMPLDESFISTIEKVREKGDNVMNELMKDDEVKNFLVKKILEKGLDKELRGELTC